MNRRAGLIGKSTNLFLLLLFLLMVGITGAITVYFSNQHEQLKTDLGDTNANLTFCQQEASALSSRLGQAIQSLNTTEEDIRKYDELYTEKAGSLEEAQQQLEEALQGLRVEQIAKQKFQELYTEAVETVDLLEEDILVLDNKIDSLNDKISDLDDQVDCLESTADVEEGDCA